MFVLSAALERTGTIEALGEWFEKIAGVSVDVDIASEFRYRSTVIEKEELANQFLTMNSTLGPCLQSGGLFDDWNFDTF